MITKNTVILFILNITFCSSVLWQRLKRNSDTEFNYLSVKYPTSTDILYFDQKLDHIHFDNRQWRQRYAVTVEFYKKGGPSFLNVYGSGPMDEGCEFPGPLLAYAKKLNAIVFTLEHRFYGRTQPVNGSILNHLSTEQALADIENFIKNVPKEFHLPKHTNWITFGCSYAGMLAAWARLKYPHLIHGSVASSAPLLAKVDYYECEQIVEESYKSYDPKCIDSITVAFKEIAHVVNSPRNRKNISQMFCLDNQFDDIATIQSIILRRLLKILKWSVQNNDYTNYITIPVVCRIMTKYNSTKLEALAEIQKMFMESKGAMDMLFEKSPDPNSEKYSYFRARNEAWRYQRCSEFGYFSSYTNTTFLSHVKHLLPPIETDIKHLCEPFFGPNFSIKNLTEKVDHTNSRYGGLNFNIQNVIFIHGSLDTWYKAGLYKKSNSSLYETIFIKGVSHCTDTIPPTDRVIPELENAFNKVLETLHSWLKPKSISINSGN